MNLLEPFRFIKHYRERADALRREMREHQLALITHTTRALEILVEGQAKQVEESTKALTEIAHSNTAQAEAFTTWIKSFQITEAPTTSTVRDEDEIADEQARLANHLGISPSAFADLPEEFQLAAQLRGDFLNSVRNDTKA